jgi:hypothetical protein
MVGVEPEPLRDHGVKIHDRIYPVKQVIEAVTGLDRLAFQSAQSRQLPGSAGFRALARGEVDAPASTQ